MQKRKRAPLELSKEIRDQLETITKSRSSTVTQVARARILLMYSDRKGVTEIARTLVTNRPYIERTIDKAHAYGPMEALKDLPRKGRPPFVTDEAKAWVLSVACQTPAALGYAAEIWTYSLLVKHIRN